MSTLRISNIEAKADSSSPTVDEQLRFTNSDGDLMLYLDGRTAGITTVGINTTNQTIKFDANNNVMVTGIITATEFHGSLAVGTSVTYGDNEKAYFGTGLDLELFHNGTNSVINNTEGALLFQNNGSSSMYIGSNGQVYLNNDITFVGASANALWDKSENYFSIPDKIVHSGDTNTAVRFPAADTFTVETAGSERLRIGINGGVGIGTDYLSGNATVYHKLMVVGDTTSTIAVANIVRKNNSAANDSYTLQVDSSAHTSNMTSGGAMSVDVNSGRAFTINGNGNVGVGTNNPITSLDVRGDVAVDYNATHALRFYTQPRNNWSSITNTATDSNANLSFKTAQGEAINITYSKLVGIGTDNPGKKLEVFDATQGVIRIRGGGGGSNSSRKADLSLFASGAREYVVRADASDAAFKIVDVSGSNAERVVITSDGRIGINDPTPNDYELDILKRSTATDAQIRLYNNATGSSNDTIIRNQIGGTSASNYIYFGDGDDTNVGQIRYQHSNDSMQFFAGAGERLTIGSNGLHTINATTYEALNINTNDNGVNGPEISLFHNSASPAVNDVIGQLRYTGRDSATNITLYSKIETKVTNVTNGSETAQIDFSTRGGGAYNNIFRLNARSTASAPSYTADDMNGIILDTYNTGNPYPRYFNFIAKAAGDTDSNIDFWTETVGGSPIDRLRVDSNGSLRTMSKGGYWQITSIHNGSGSGNWYNGSAAQRIYPNYIDNNTGYAEFYMTFHPSTSYSGYGEPTLVIRGGNYLQTTGEIAISYNGRTNSPSSGTFRALHAQYQWMIYNDGDTDAYSGMRSIDRYTQNKTSAFVDDTTHSIDYIASNDGRYGTNSEPIIDQRSYIKIKLNGVSGNVAIQGHTVFCKFTCYTNGDKEWAAYMYYN